jgi:hypothetical protein
VTAFDTWLETFLRAYYARRPVSATFIGVHDFDDRLPDLSEDGTFALAAESEDQLVRLRALPSEPLTDAQFLDRQLAEGFLRIQRWEATSDHFGPNPCLFTGEAIFGLVSLLLRPVPSLQDARARLLAIPGFLSVARHRIKSAPVAWIERARHECAGAKLLLADTAVEFPALHESGIQASQAFASFDEFLSAEVTPTQAYACGSEALELLLRHAHMWSNDADGVERLALERLALEEDAIAREGPRHAEQLQLDNQGPSGRNETGDYLARFEAWRRAALDLARHRDLMTVPHWPVRFVERPAWARRSAPYLYFLPYRSPPPFDALPDVDYLLPPGSDESTIKLNHVLHHASLGHHVQNWFAARASSRIGQIAAVDCASRIAMLCGGTLAEGWANYAVDLAEEGDADFLTPLERFGQHRARLRMAARAIVDVRLHRARFTLDDAIDFYTARVGMQPSAARSEAVKNSLYPGAACMYLIGWDAIWRLRRELEARDGPHFSLHAFHDRLLSFGSVPVSLIARAMLETTTVAAHS